MSDTVSQSTTQPHISLIICAYTERRWDDIVEAIDSIKRQTLKPHELILVIDHNPGLLRRARESLDGVIIVENAAVRGASGSRNVGLDHATGNFVAFLDDDAVAAEDWLERLYANCRDHDVLGAGGYVRPLWVGPRPAWFPEEFLWVVGCSYRGLPKRESVVRNPFGGCSCVRREVFDGIGGFRTEIGRVGTRPIGCEETELAVRAGQTWPDRHFVYDPRAVIGHKVPAWRATFRYFVARCYDEGLSKAWLAWQLGAQDGLSSERTYVTRTLPSGVALGLVDGILRGQTGGFGRAAAIVVGLAATVAGYVVGTTRERLRAPLQQLGVRIAAPADAERAV